MILTEKILSHYDLFDKQGGAKKLTKKLQQLFQRRRNRFKKMVEKESKNADS